MTRLTGTGKPTRKTPGAIGDIYTDTETGKEYKCTFACDINNGMENDFEWKEIKKQETDKPVSEKKLAEDTTKPTEEEKTEPAVENSEQDIPVESKRKDYTSYSKKNR